MNQPQTPDNEIGNQMKTNIKEVNEHINNLNNEVARLREENDEYKLSEAALSEELKISDDWLKHTRNEVARLREFIESIMPPPPYGELEPEWRYAQKLLAETAPAPEEPDQFRNATKMVIKLSKRPYEYECGDGCCQEWGETWFVNGVEVCSGPCDDNRLQQLLDHLGYDARIVNENEDGEEVCEL